MSKQELHDALLASGLAYIPVRGIAAFERGDPEPDLVLRTLDDDELAAFEAMSPEERDVACLQAALRHVPDEAAPKGKDGRPGLYAGRIDGKRGPVTEKAVKALGVGKVPPVRPPFKPGAKPTRKPPA